MAGLKVPMLPKAAPIGASTTAIVGSTRWGVPLVFSVVNSSSWSGSAAPAPTPRAETMASVELQRCRIGSDLLPTASGLMGMGAPQDSEWPEMSGFGRALATAASNWGPTHGGAWGGHSTGG